MGSRAASQALVPGRVVLLTNPASGLPELAALCGAPHAAPSRGVQLGSAAAAPTGALPDLAPKASNLIMLVLALCWCSLRAGAQALSLLGSLSCMLMVPIRNTSIAAGWRYVLLSVRMCRGIGKAILRGVAAPALAAGRA